MKYAIQTIDGVMVEILPTYEEALKSKKEIDSWKNTSGVEIVESEE